MEINHIELTSLLALLADQKVFAIRCSHTVIKIHVMTENGRIGQTFYNGACIWIRVLRKSTVKKLSFAHNCFKSFSQMICSVIKFILPEIYIKAS